MQTLEKNAIRYEEPISGANPESYIYEMRKQMKESEHT